MTVQTTCSRPTSMIPETAPFSPEQRAWLNGFFAGLLSLDGGPAPRRSTAPCRMRRRRRCQRGRRCALARRCHADRRAHDAGRGQAAAARACWRPWPSRTAASAATCARPTRQAIAEGNESEAQPLRARRQGNEPHAQASPGGDACRRGAPAPAPAARCQPRRSAAARHRAMRPSKQCSSRRRRLNGDGSEKDTRHVVFDLSGSGLGYAPGDTLRRLSQERSGAGRGRASPPCACRPTTRSAASALARRAHRGLCALRPHPTRCSSCGQLAGGERAPEARRRWPMAKIPTATRRRSTCWTLLRGISSARAADPELRGVRWSRCSRGSIPSPRRRAPTPGEVHLTVDAVRYGIGGRGAPWRRLDLPRRSRRSPARPVQSTSRSRTASRLPQDPRHADHHGRPRHRHRAVPRVPAGSQATGAKGRAWLFFGHQQQATRLPLPRRTEECWPTAR